MFCFHFPQFFNILKLLLYIIRGSVMDYDRKEKLHKLIETIPEDMMPVIYKMINLLKSEWVLSTKKNGQRGSLAGIWKSSQIDDTLFDQAKKSIYPYEK